MRFEPTDRQRDVLESDGDLLVVGPPGSGKTSIALEKARRFIESHSLNPHHRVLFLSFSNAAVHRIREAAMAGLSTDHRTYLEITTFHAFCYQFLSAHWRLAGLGDRFTLLPSEEESVLESRLQDEQALQEELERREREEGAVTFDRFAPLVVNVLSRVDVVRTAYARAYPLIIADEYQDTDDSQHAMLSQLRSSGQVICLGDPEQRIFDYREGVRSDRLERTEEEFGLRRIILEQNHRNSSSDIHTVAQAVLRGRELIPEPDSVMYWGYWNRTQLNDFLKMSIINLEDEIRRVTEEPERSVSLGIMAFTNEFVGYLSTLLREPTDRFDRPFSHHVAVPPDQVATAWDAVLAVLEPRMSVNAKVTYVLRAAAELNWINGSRTAREQAQRLERWAEELSEGELSRRAQGVWTLRDRIGDAVLNFTGDPAFDTGQVVEAFEDLPGDHLQRVVKIVRLRPIAASPSKLTETLATTYSDTGAYIGARAAGEEYLLRQRMDVGGEARRGRVLMTMHKCKGKEFDAVILAEGRHRSRFVARDEQNAEEQPYSRRILQVAISRARYGAVILHPADDRSPLLPGFT